MTEVKSLPVASQESEAKQQFPCLLCGQPAVTSGLYFPSPTSPIAPPEGKVRVILYGLCDDCLGQYKKLLPTIETLIEQQMMVSPCWNGGRKGSRSTKFGRVWGDSETGRI